MHSFDIEKEDNVLKAWQELDERTTAEGEKAKEVFFGKQLDARKVASKEKHDKRLSEQCASKMFGRF